MNIRLDAEPRSDFGKGAARRLRRDGRIPVVLYGSGSELIHLSLPGHELEQAHGDPALAPTIEPPTQGIHVLVPFQGTSCSHSVRSCGSTESGADATSDIGSLPVR